MDDQEEFQKAAKWAIHFLERAPLEGKENAALYLAQTFLHAIERGELVVARRAPEESRRALERRELALAEVGERADSDS